MSVFVLGGKAKGFEVALPSKVSFKPTSVMLRRKLFDYKQDWSGLHFIDLCAGSGAMGFEALSRGASVLFNDISKQQLKIVQQHVDKWLTRFPEDKSLIEITHLDSLKYLNNLAKLGKDSWLFFDPPYNENLLYQNLFLALNKMEISSGAGVIIEYEVKKNIFPPWYSDFEKFSSHKYVRELQSSDRRLVIVQGD